jgi:hypothetical protein
MKFVRHKVKFVRHKMKSDDFDPRRFFISQFIKALSGALRYDAAKEVSETDSTISAFLPTGIQVL